MTFAAAVMCFVAADGTVTTAASANGAWPLGALVVTQESSSNELPPLPPPPPTTTTLAPTTTTTAPFVVPTSPDQWFAPSGRNQGTEGLAVALANIALRDNSPLYLSDTWGRTTGGANSDHHVSRSDSWAVDVAVRGIQSPTPTTQKAAERIGSALGEPGWTSGELIKTIDGYRFQVLWLVSGHFNHVHVGVRKV